MRSGVCRSIIRLYRPVQLAMPLVALCIWMSLTGWAQVSVTTYHNDNLRTGQNTSETILTPSNVNSSEFGKLFSQTVDGFIYGQPLYVPNVKVGSTTHNVVYVATMNDSVYAFDADNNAGSNASPLWKVNFTDPSEGITTVSTTDVNCSDPITTEIGIMSTPVIDPVGGTIYLIARTKENGVFYQRLHALDITSGKEKFGGPIVIQATVNGSGKGSVGGKLSFNAKIQNQRSALLLQNGLVYIGWGSLCDENSYHGWLMAYNETTLAQTAVWVSTPNGSEGAIWASGWGPAGDSSFNTFIPTANGTFDGNTSGVDYAQTFVKLGPPSGGTFPLLDYFTPYDATNLDTGDHDIGSGGLVLLPNQTGAYAHLLVQSDKLGDIYVVNRDNMGHFNSVNNNQIVQYLPAANRGMWNSPTWWNNFVYFGGSGDLLKAFSFNPSTGLLSTSPASETSKAFGYPGTTAAVSSNGTSNGILWTLNNAGYKAKGAAVLYAFDPSNLKTQYYSSSQNSTRDNPGLAVKFTIPTVVNGKVYVGTQAKLSVFGLLAGGKN